MFSALDVALWFLAKNHSKEKEFITDIITNIAREEIGEEKEKVVGEAKKLQERFDK